MFQFIRKSILILAACIALLHVSVIHNHIGLNAGLDLQFKASPESANIFFWFQKIFQDGSSQADNTFTDFETDNDIKNELDKYESYHCNLNYSNFPPIHVFDFAKINISFYFPQHFSTLFSTKILRGPPYHVIAIKRAIVFFA